MSATPSVEQARLALDVLALRDPQSTGCADAAREVLRRALTDVRFGVETIVLPPAREGVTTEPADPRRGKR